MGTSLIYEGLFDDDIGMDTNDTSGSNNSLTASELLKPLENLKNIENAFNSVYKELTNTTEDSILSNKMQNFDVEDLVGKLKDIQKQSGKQTPSLTKEEQFINSLMNNKSSELLKNSNDFTVPMERKKRYSYYEEIPNINHISYRMLRVYLDNIFIKNLQTKQYLNIIENPENMEFIKNSDTSIKKGYQDILKSEMIYFNLQKRLKDEIIPKTLTFGNYFLEIVDLKIINKINDHPMLLENTNYYLGGNASNAFINFTDDNVKDIKNIKNSSAILFENYYDISPGISEDEIVEIYESFLDPDTTDKKLIEESESEVNNLTTQYNFLKTLLKQNNEGIVEEFDMNFINDIVSQDEKEYNFDDLSKLKLETLSNIYIRNIHPENVIIVQYDGTLIGYIITEDIESSSGGGNEINVFQRFASENGYDKKSSKGSTEDDKVINSKIVSDIADNLTDTINDIVKRSNRHIKLFDTTDSIISNDLNNTIKLLIYNHVKRNSRLKFRFVGNNNIVNFSGNKDKYAPYGTSIFDPVILPVKMYTLALMASIVSRLSRASVVRKWNVEVGNKKNHAQIIQQLKNDIKNQAISFDKLSDIKNISNVITDFRDMATVQMNGNKFIDMEILPMNDRSLPLNDLNDLRNELITATGIPSVYLNIGDAVDLRETLVNLNTTFAGNIISYQSSFEESINHLINILFKIILKNSGYDNSLFNITNYFKISFNPPLVLQIQANEALISSVSNIIGLLQTARVATDPIKLFKLYIPQIDWDNIQKDGEDFMNKLGKNKITGQDDQTV